MLEKDRYVDKAESIIRASLQIRKKNRLIKKFSPLDTFIGIAFHL